MGSSIDDSKQSGSGDGVKMEGDNASDLVKAHISEIDVSTLERNSSHGPIEKMKQTIQASTKNPIIGSYMKFNHSVSDGCEMDNIPSLGPAHEGLGDSGDPPMATLSVSDVTEHHGSDSGNRTEASKVSPRSSPDVIRLGNTTPSVKPDDIDYHSRGTVTLVEDHSDARNIHNVADDVSTSSNKPFPKESLESSLETRNFEAQTQIQTGIDPTKVEGEEVCNMQIDPPVSEGSSFKYLSSSNEQELNSSAAGASHEKDISQFGEVVAPDNSENHLPVREENADDSCENGLIGSTVVMEEPHKSEAVNEADASQVGAVVLKVFSENIDDSCENGLVESSAVMGEPHKTEAGNEASQVDVVVPKEFSEHMVLPSSPLVGEEEKDNRSFEQGLAGSSIEPETSSETSKKDVSNADVFVSEITPEHTVLPQSSLEAEENVIVSEITPEHTVLPQSSLEAEENVIVSEITREHTVLNQSSLEAEENFKGSLENYLACHLVVPGEEKGSEAEIDDQIGILKVSESAPETLDPQPSSLVLEEEEQVEGSSKNGAPCQSVILQKPGGSKAEAGEQLDASHADTSLPENASENMVSPRLSLASEAPVVEGLSEKDTFDNSVVVVESKGSAANKDQTIPSQVDGIMPATNVGLPSSFIGMQESEIESTSENQVDSSVSDKLKTSVIEEESRGILSEVGGIVPETSLVNIAVLSSSETAGENVNRLSEKSSHILLLALEESKQFETENSNQIVVSELPMTGPADSLENMCQPSCSLSMDVDKVEDYSEKSPCGVTVQVKESKGAEIENDESHVASMVYESQVVGTESEHTQVGSVGPEDTFGNKDKSSSSLGMQEDKIGGSSNRSETETDDQTQCGGMAITNMSENSAQLSSSLVEEKADVLLEKGSA
ncbi:hypothetical protein OIU77_011401 [Salix suchowensis]|uniref:Uncharacterized protein n=1 Tax=Salix suchowensis TaxID=1278906 RepID=A0ABQ9A0H7_9ROSI|nr:hypothetical protein OIU77_011401 [Salix suchowensis]